MKEFWSAIAHRHNFTSFGPMGMELSSMMSDIVGGFITMYRMPYTYCFIVPIDRPRPLGSLLIDPFDLPIWICIMITNFLVLLTLWSTQPKPYSFSRASLELVQININSPHETPRRPMHRLIITIFIAGTFILTTSYQSLITATISEPSYYPPLDTLARINSTCNPMVKLHPMESNYHFLHEASTDDGEDLKFHWWKCFHGSCAFFRPVYELFADRQRINALFRSAPCRKSRLETLPIPTVGAITVHHPALEELMQFYATAFAQGGLYHFTEDGGGGRGRVEEDGGVKVFTVQDLDLVWRIVIYGWVIGGVAFVGEVVYFWLKRCLGVRHFSSR